MTDDAAFTDDPYEPGEVVAGDLEELLESMRVVDKVEQETEVLDRQAIVRDFEAILDEDSVDVHETQSAVGVQASVTGPIGLSAAYVLANALRWGEPTLLYADELPTGAGGDRYQDLTAEWFVPAAVAKGVDDVRREQLGERYEALDLELLEDLAATYLG